MKKILTSTVLILVFLVTLVPFVHAVPLVPCGTEVWKASDSGVKGDVEVTDASGNKTNVFVDRTGTVKNPCGYQDLLTLVKRVTDFLILMASGVATLVFAYAGFLYITAAGDTGKIQQAHQIFTKVAIGFALMLSAYFIVVLIQKALIPDAKVDSDGGSGLNAREEFRTLDNLPK